MIRKMAPIATHMLDLLVLSLLDVDIVINF